MKFADVCDLMEQIAPREKALSWDHVGLMIGDRETEVTGVLTCLDVTMEVLSEAVLEGCNVIISHHPFFFHPIQALDYEQPRGRMTAFAVQHGIQIYSAHTNLDYAEAGVNRALAEWLGLSAIHWDESEAHLIGRMESNSLQNLLQQISGQLSVPLKVVLPAGTQEMQPDNGGEFTVGVSCGAFDGETDWCQAEKIGVLITGELKHSDAIDLKYMPFVTVSAGHYATEHMITDSLARTLQKLGCPAWASRRETDPLTVWACGAGHP